MSRLAIFARKRRRKRNRETLSGFECGFDSKHFGRTSFSINFCIFLILFLVFDIELVFFFHLPILAALESRVALFLFVAVGGFIFGGFLYEEKNMA